MRWVAAIAVLVAVMLMTASPAAADPAGPTDYRSEIVSVDPPAPNVTVEMIGGDSFIRMVVPAGTSVEIIGYHGEPYLRFGPDGTVEVNDSSPTTYLNEDRYAAVSVPDRASPDAQPAWRAVADDGAYAWHDHRTHWMNESRPAAQPGDQILEAVIPVVVDGRTAEVSVISTWEPPPSPLPGVVGAVLGVCVGLFAGRAVGRTGAAVLAMVGLAATAVSAVAYLSVPAETAPSLVPLIIALLATATAGYGAVRRIPDVLISVTAPALVLIGWATLRRQWLLRAILPTTIPAIDRLITAMTLTAAVAALVAAAVVAVRERRRGLRPIPSARQRWRTSG